MSTNTAPTPRAPAAAQGVSLRILSTSAKARTAGDTFPLGPEGAVIGRADDCSIVLQDGGVSRHHAIVEATPQGFVVRDNKSVNGLVVGTERHTEIWLTNGVQFAIGGTVFEFVAPQAAAAAHEFIIRIVEAKNRDSVGKEYVVSGVVSIGRGSECTIQIKDPSASTKHAFVEAAGDGFVVRDNKSANGLWIDDRRITDAPLTAGQRFRVGDTFLECQPRVEEKEAETVAMTDLDEMMSKVASRHLAEAGEVISVSGHGIMLDDPESVYFIVSGKVEIFTLPLVDGQPQGARTHFLTIPQGDALFGMDLRYATDASFMALGKGDTVVVRLARERLLNFSKDLHASKLAIRLIESWIARLSTRLVSGIRDRPSADVSIDPGKSAPLPVGQRMKSSGGVAWLESQSDALLYIGMATLTGDDAGTWCPFPLTPQTWIEAASDAAGALTIGSVATATLVTDAARLWPGLDAFHRALVECESVNRKLGIIAEAVRLDDKAQQAAAAKEEAMGVIGAVLTGQNDSVAMAAVGSVKPLVEACRLVAAELGMKVQPAGESKVPRTLNEQVLAIAAASRFRTRQVALRGQWWRHDQGPMLAIVADTNSPVALMPKGPRKYEAVDPATGERQPVSQDLANTLQPFAYSFYRPLPVGKMGARDLVRFGARGMSPDFMLLGMMGVATGVLGAVTPYLIGRIVDDAIPTADRGLLWQLGFAMLLTALASAAFKITQSIAVVRIESRLDYTLAAAIWDRLLDLPSGFFRQFGAGDLAERAGGINAIRGVVSRAGVGGILGAFSSVAYIGVMMMYSFQLAAVAIAISLVLVTVTTVGNYRQLTFQRNESAQRGRISSLVLQLVTGVAKVRVCAAENHAFKVWASLFSTSKRTGFSIGQVQNVVGTFTSSFQVMSSIGIFATLYYIRTSVAGAPPAFTTGEFIAFNAAFGSFITAFQSLSDASMSLLKAVPTFERLKPILETSPESDETKIAPGKLRGEITISHLHFRYTPEMPWVVKDVSFTIKPGQMVAFVGSSGCGKSTLLRLMLGFERPASGTIAYDGQDMSMLDVRALRQQLGVVLQESRVLPTDIFRNIVGATAHTMDEAWEAARMAGLYDDIKEMPMGMHTIVSEGGGTFSGGQRQRLLIARALVNKPSLIFFDEATSALDNKAQAIVTESMDRMDATRIVIAHRLSTIVNADLILYFDGGQIREQGTYQELIAKNGAFAALAKRQIA